MAELDASAAQVIRMIEEANLPRTETLSPAQARKAYEDARGVLSPEPPAIAEIRDIAIPGPGGEIPARLYRDGADGAPRAGLVYFHGGGWVIGSVGTHDTVCRQIAQRSGAVVISVDYRMGPEHKFPAAVEDSIAATDHVARNAADFGIDPGRIAVGGDSAGGNLAAVVAIHARDNDGPAIGLQLLVYPATDFSMTQESHRAFAEGYVLTRPAMEYFQGHYLRSDADREDWRASPSRVADLSHLPPALVITGGFDPLRDEGEEYALRLAQAGVPTTLRRFPGQVHGFLTMGKVIPEAGKAVGEIVTAISARLGG